ncbi:transglutaminase-like enzyme, predicted cysteine protease [Thermoplasmatales archaeon SCGC AB-540-F20]|nr:transglutaminase-like enzyme, predicted cysteine protease [Thermoplasmatales archaeon SCGC AB-540-F20]
MVKITEGKKLIAVIILLIIVFSAISVSGFVYFQIQYTKVTENYNDVKDSYDTLHDEYYDLKWDYDDLISQYDELNENYNTLSETFQMYSRLSIDSLMMLTYNEIRSEIQPNYNPWLGQYYYNKLSVEYGTYVCSHDLARRYWPNIEDDYYDIRGTYLHNDAYDIIAYIIESIGISKYDSNTDRIEKILNFIYDNIEYSEDINDEFLFPVEVLTYRSGDCDDFSILASTLFEYAGIESSIGFFTNESEDTDHCMVLVNLPDLDNYGYWYYDDLTNQELSKGRWIIIEPQATIDMQHEDDLISKWKMIAVAEVPN